MKNFIDLYEKKYDKNDIQIIGREKVSIEKLIKSIDTWHSEIAKIILLPNNLYYYATNNFDSDFYLDQLEPEKLDEIKMALEGIIKQPEKFYEEYQEKSEYYNLVKEAESIEELKNIVKKLGLKKNKNLGDDLEKAKLKIQKQLCTDFCFGVFGEILFYSVVENILCNKLLISKVALITAPSTNAHGSDGIFCDELEKKLYFGEAKFTVNLEAGIQQALYSMTDCVDRIKNDKNFMLVHRKDLKNGYGQIISKDNILNYENKIIIFLLHGEEYNQEEIVNHIEKAKKRFGNKLESIGFIIISFPIYDKEHLKRSIALEVDNYGK